MLRFLLILKNTKDNGKEIVDKCLEEGLILNSPKPSTIRLMPPLIVTKEDTDKMVHILSKVLDTTLQTKGI